MDPSTLILRLAVAAVLGCLVGIDRERRDWRAGLRDHMLVCLGAALFMIVSGYGFTEVVKSPGVVLDPSRVAAQVVSGIGFLGAGTILVRGEIIKGLTTAASLWAIAAVGLAVGGGLYTASIAATALILVILAGIKPLERYFFPDRRQQELSLRVERDLLDIKAIEGALGSLGAELIEVTVRRSEDASKPHNVDLTVHRPKDCDAARLLITLQALPGVLTASQHRIP